MSKSWRSRFVLDESKLTRIHDVLVKRFPSNAVSFSFVLTSKNGTTAKLANVREVLNMDNRVRNPVRSIVISAEAIADSELQARLEYKEWRDSNDRREKNVELDVRGQDAAVVSEVFAAVEEQIDRTIESSLPQFVAFAFVVIVSVLLILLVLPHTSTAPMGQRLYLSDIQELSEASKSVTDEASQIAFLFDLHRREIEFQRRTSTASGTFTLRDLALVAPALVVLILFLYLLLACYPRAVFSWGDFATHYARIIDRRKTIWNVIYVAIALGLVVNLAAARIWDSGNHPP